MFAWMRLRGLSLVLTWMLISALPFAASAQDDSTKQDSPDATEPAAQDTLSDEELQEFADSFEVAMYAQNFEQVNALIDWQAIVDSATDGLGDSPELQQARRDFAAGFISSVTKETGFAGAIVQAIKDGGSYDFLRSLNVDKSQRVLFRLLLENGGVNYHEFLVARTADGTVRAVDYYTAAQGELVTEMIRRNFLPEANLAKEDEANLAETDKAHITGGPLMLRMINYFHQGEYSKALKTYDAMPDVLQREKVVLLPRIAAAQQLGGDEYRAALADLQKFHPNDRCVDLLSIDAHLFNEDYDQALACIDKVDKSVGGDPYLHVLRAGVYVNQKKYDKANEAAEKAVAEEPQLISAYWTLINIALTEKKFDRVVELLNTIEREFTIEFADLTTIEDYAEFVKSPEYKAWIESRPKRAPQEPQKEE